MELHLTNLLQLNTEGSSFETVVRIVMAPSGSKTYKIQVFRSGHRWIWDGVVLILIRVAPACSLQCETRDSSHLESCKPKVLGARPKLVIV